MVFAAGLGTRLRPLTDSKPKALIELGGKTFLENVITKLIHFSVDEIVVNVHHFAGQIIDFLEQNNNFGITIHISDERGQLLDTGGGLKKAAPFLAGGEPVIIYNVDILSDISLSEVVEYHKRKRALATIVVRKRETQRYLLFDEDSRLIGWKNTATGEEKISIPGKSESATPLAFSGIHVISPGIFRHINQEGRFSIIGTYLELSKKHKIIGYRDRSGYWMDIGRPEQLKEAGKLFKTP